MKIGGDYKLREIGLRQWKKFVAEQRLNAEGACRKDSKLSGANA